MSEQTSSSSPSTIADGRQQQQNVVTIKSHRRIKLRDRERRVKIITVRASDSPGGLLRYDNSGVKVTGLDLAKDKTLPMASDQTPSPDSTPFSIREYLSLMMGLEEVRHRRLHRALLTELIGTAVFTYLSVAIVIAVVNFYNFSVNYRGNPLGMVANPWQAFFIAALHCLLLVIMIIACGPNSGGILNPVITFATMITGFTTIAKGILYICAQLVGAIIGSALIYASVPHEVYNRTLMATCQFGNQMTKLNALAAEFAFGFFNLLIAFNVALDPRQVKTFGVLAPPLIIGFALFITLFASQGLLSFYAGPGFNIARCFGPAVPGDAHHPSTPDFWIFIVGPLLAATAIGTLVNVIPPFKYERWKCPN
ncbi:hypothetical protein SAMD00019534_090760 [Acytostelium subglobosum LB1]|uniref:hypothetical protein n=1 Tax=Acytostelium subglobosum LB1 TaxID=1410327 RepID=UPI000644B86C|nr:hypothetical protein SAMD00019534_090760 [Acytostelium subglobosum LB1]GAM25901.1 hypothetical protein SAMD00019534_090760 [Acytostelium subglobosum LB1]|eukprot:XP_012750944.1 hypothetical protein SAMD00019534_090760 [Acytostelium subglobosum LB1]